MLPLRHRLAVDFAGKDGAYMGPDRFVSTGRVLFEFYQTGTFA
jgi:hypothetical protein